MTRDEALLPVPPRPAQFFELSADYVVADAAGQLSTGWRLGTGEHSWLYRAQNFVIGLTWLDAGSELRHVDTPDEHVLAVLDEASVEVSAAGQGPVQVGGQSLVVVPAGESRVVGSAPGFVLSVFTARATQVLAQARNSQAYAVRDPAVEELPALTPSRAPRGLQVYSVADFEAVGEVPGRPFRTDSLTVNWFEPEVGPADTSRMTPHSHADYEQASVTLAGEYVHHVRRPWTARLADWRADEHVHVTSPSITIIPAGNIHTSRPIGAGLNQRIDVFGVPRPDFVDRGMFINKALYERS
ncbi:hypothetical protein [Acrocarpospora catenulata]|uniref:hypothetical protein n=1 Tax=Acrocarpospora catenulata TaxID=2836182 RepID=UPI001BD97574|nr:hypothetical protein [Acrocarpospora catenulata]